MSILFLSRMTLAGWRDTRAPFAQPIHQSISKTPGRTNQSHQKTQSAAACRFRLNITMVHHTHWEPEQQLSWQHQHVKLFSSTTAGQRIHKISYLRAVTSPTVQKLKTTTNKQINKEKQHIEKKPCRQTHPLLIHKMVGKTKFRLCPVVQRLNPAHVHTWSVQR